MCATVCAMAVACCANPAHYRADAAPDERGVHLARFLAMANKE